MIDNCINIVKPCLTMFNHHLLNRIRARSLLELRMQRRLGQLQVSRLSAGAGSSERRAVPFGTASLVVRECFHGLMFIIVCVHGLFMIVYVIWIVCDCLCNMDCL